MSARTLSRWEQDIDGGEHGVLTLCLYVGDVSIPLPNFTTAHELQQAIEREMRQVRHDARASLLNEIARIQP